MNWVPRGLLIQTCLLTRNCLLIQNCLLLRNFLLIRNHILIQSCLLIVPSHTIYVDHGMKNQQVLRHGLLITGFIAPDQLPDETTAFDIRDSCRELGPLPTDDSLTKTERACPLGWSFYLCCISDARVAFNICQYCLPSKFFLVYYSQK